MRYEKIEKDMRKIAEVHDAEVAVDSTVSEYAMTAANKDFSDKDVANDVVWALTGEGEPSIPGRRLEKAFKKKEDDQ